MTINIIKLCVGVKEMAELEAFQRHRLETQGRIFHVTRMVPKRQREVLNGGSLYWVMAGTITARQKITDIEVFTDHEGIRRCRLVLDRKLVPVQPTPRRAFQGWRYLTPQDAPVDLSRADRKSDMPPKMRAELAELGLL